MKDNHPSVSLLDVGDSVREGVSDYRYPGEITDKEWVDDHWEYVVKANTLKPMRLAKDWIIPSEATRKQMYHRIDRIKQQQSGNPMESLIRSEVKSVIKEYFHEMGENRQLEVQEFLEYRLEREQLQEFINNPKRGRRYLRQEWPDRFYWWANEDIERFFKNWRI